MWGGKALATIAFPVVVLKTSALIKFHVVAACYHLVHIEAVARSSGANLALFAR